MSNTVGVFDYVTIEMEKEDLWPPHPEVQIVLDYFWREEGSIAPSISPSLMTEKEIDLYIPLLKKDLDAVAKKAKAALRRAQKETKILTSNLPRKMI